MWKRKATIDFKIMSFLANVEDLVQLSLFSNPKT